MRLGWLVILFAFAVTLGTAGVTGIAATAGPENGMMQASGAGVGAVECVSCEHSQASRMSCGELCATFHMIALSEPEQIAPQVDRLAFPDAFDRPNSRLTSPEPFPPKLTILNSVQSD